MTWPHHSTGAVASCVFSCMHRQRPWCCPHSLIPSFPHPHVSPFPCSLASLLDPFRAMAVRGMVTGCVDSWLTPLPMLRNIGGGGGGGGGGREKNGHTSVSQTVKCDNMGGNI